MTTANEKQIGGKHYKGYAIQPWDYILSNKLGYLEGSAIKYITRWKEKGGIADIDKAIHFLEKLKEHYFEEEAAVKVAYKDEFDDLKKFQGSVWDNLGEETHYIPAGVKIGKIRVAEDGTQFFSMEPVFDDSN